MQQVWRLTKQVFGLEGKKWGRTTVTFPKCYGKAKQSAPAYSEVLRQVRGCPETLQELSDLVPGQSQTKGDKEVGL